jgi:hypothetical protein
MPTFLPSTTLSGRHGSLSSDGRANFMCLAKPADPGRISGAPPRSTCAYSRLASNE